MSSGWDEIQKTEQANTDVSAHVEAAWKSERERCVRLVRAEIAEGVSRGVPLTSGAMLILHRLEAAIGNG